MNDTYKHYMPPASAKRAIRLEVQSDNPSLTGEDLDTEVRRRYKTYLDKWNGYFKTTRLRYLR